MYLLRMKKEFKLKIYVAKLSLRGQAIEKL